MDHYSTRSANPGKLLEQLLRRPYHAAVSGRLFLIACVPCSAVAIPVDGHGSVVAARALGVPSQTELYHLDTETAQYTQLANNLVRLRLYNSPVGQPDWVNQS